MTWIDTSILLAYLVMLIALGIYALRKQETVEDYYLAGRRLGPVTIACLWMASWVGGASIVGSSSRAFELGITSVWYIAAIALGCLVFGLTMAARIKQESDEHAHFTFPDYLEHRFDAKTRLVSTIVMMISFVAVSAGQLVAAAAILQVLLGWEFHLALIVAAAVVVGYTAVGGYLAVTYTDWMQFTLLLVGLVVVGMPIAIAKTGSWADLRAALPAAQFDLGASGWGNIVSLVASIVMSFYVSMDSYTRCYAARDPQAARNGALLAVLFIIPMAISATWLGLSAAVLFPEAQVADGILTVFVLETFPVGLKGLVLVAILAAIMSSADICILSASANYSKDLHARFISPGMEEGAILRLGIGASVVIGLLALLMAWTLQDIIGLLQISFTVLSASLFIPITLATFRKQVNPTATFWSVCLSLITVIAWRTAQGFGAAGWFQIDPLYPGLLISGVSLALVCALSADQRPTGSARGLSEFP
ncbi:MAG: sodium:solute symporter family protein [Pseudomonadota bacterium]